MLVLFPVAVLPLESAGQLGAGKLVARFRVARPVRSPILFSTTAANCFRADKLEERFQVADCPLRGRLSSVAPGIRRSVGDKPAELFPASFQPPRPARSRIEVAAKEFAV
jgi:hypothetical protein